MKILVFRNADEGSQYAANMVLNRLRNKNNLVIGLATGSTPIRMYEYLARDHETNQTSWLNVTTFNLDEYKGVKDTDPDSYHYFMNQHFFSKLGIDLARTHFPTNKNDYDQEINNFGGIDLQILGIGRNGHIGFNEPGSSELSRTRLVDLDETTIQANAQKFFNGDIKQVPKRAYTMGLKTIMDAKEIILLAFGRDKSHAIKTMISANKFDPNCPATVLIKHPNVTVIVDPEVELGM